MLLKDTCSAKHHFLPHFNPFQCGCRIGINNNTLNIPSAALAGRCNLHSSTAGVALPKELTRESEECDSGREKKKINTSSLNFANSLAAVPVEIASTLLQSEMLIQPLASNGVPVTPMCPRLQVPAPESRASVGVSSISRSQAAFPSKV